MPRQPVEADFPAPAVVKIFPAPENTPLTHAVVLLHGLGDTLDNFAHLADRLPLPQATIIVLQAPNPMPFDLGGFHWGHDLVFARNPNDANDEQLTPEAEFGVAKNLLGQVVIRDVLVGKCGFTAATDIILWGYAQGAMVALDVAASHTPVRAVVSVGGWMPIYVRPRDILDERPTEVLVCGGASAKSDITAERYELLTAIFPHLKRLRFNKPDDVMPSTTDEMAPILRFLLMILIPDELRKQGLIK
ncbi:uncharacterized protein V1510DRAFT_412469 [Dipodascopsis tothii]|uniref:uncharacterized protein n=1 Tax=Dipodascopsis tothii TaxID=44089 RepID=UPI0034CE7EC5